LGFLGKLKQIPCRNEIKRDANAGMDIVHGDNEEAFVIIEFPNPVSAASNKLADGFHKCSGVVYVKT
jgi:hypothetical protein